MNILFTSDLSGMGGGETSLVNLCEVMKQKDKVFALCASEGKLVSILGDLKIQTFVLNYRDKTKIVQNIIAIRDIIKRNNIECIHNNDPLTSVIMMLAAYGLKCRNYWTCHGQWYEFGHVKKLLIHNANKHVFCVSTAVKDNLLRMGFKHLSVTYLGIPIQKYKNESLINNIREELALDNNTFLIGCIGRFQRIKGQLKIIQAVEKLVEEHRNIMLLLIGGCIYNSKEEKEYYNEIKEYVKSKKLDGVVKFLGERSDIPSIMHQLDLLAIPSENESFGMVAIEAMASELAVISTPNDGVKEIMENNPLIVSETNDSEGLYILIKNYIEDVNVRDAILKYEKNRVLDFDISIVSNRYLKEFKKGEKNLASC